MAPGYTNFDTYCKACEFNNIKECDYNPPLESIVAPATIIEPEDTTKVKIDNPWKEGETPRHTDMFGYQKPRQTVSNLNIPVVEDDAPLGPPTTSLEAELLHFHQKFGHISFDRLRDMARIGVIPKRLVKARNPACAACFYSKMTRKPWRNKPKLAYEPKPITEPGEMVSVDQLTSPTPGFIAQMTGILTTKRYKYATVFVDHASKLGYVHLQKTSTAEETIEAKKLFEAYARDRGVHIKAYHADNGVFRANKWRDECRRTGQPLTFSGVKAHHTNGMAEKQIQDLQDLTRTQMIHAAHRWEKCITANLWPYALKISNDMLNHTPSPKDKAKRSPEQIFSKTVTHVNQKHYHPFGCPCYVLEDPLQDNKPYNKWKERSRVGIYLGQSPEHGRNVALVLNRYTGLVSPQFHVKFDDTFHTVKDVKLQSLWQEKAGFIKHEVTTTQTKQTKKTKMKPPIPPIEGGLATKSKRVRFEGLPEPTIQPTKRMKTLHETPGPPNKGGQAIAPIITINQKPQKATAPTADKVQKHGNSPVKPHVIKADATEIITNDSDQIEGEIFCFSTLLPDGENIIETIQDPLYAYKTTADPDTLYYHEAMRQNDRNEFKIAMQKEIDDRMKGNNFSLIKKSDVPTTAEVLPAVWQLRRKRDIKTRKIKKHKARLNVDGSRMREGVHYDQSYAPVASWNSIRMLLTLTAIHGWHTKQLDYVAAFPQAPAERELYMKIPAGTQVQMINGKPSLKVGRKENDDYILKVHKNLYGQKNAGRVWNQYLIKRLFKIGFKQSKIDECVFYKGKVLYVLYTDDSILAGPDAKEIESIIEQMKAVKLDITIEGDLEDFLGVNITRKGNEIHLTQPHLIDSILKDLRLDQPGVKSKDTPACPSYILKRHSDSPAFDKEFDYRSVIGKLNYLERGSRSDIAYIVHQCARFSSDPKREHGKAIKWLGRYLLGTRDKGTILKPCHSKDLEVFVDADFAGNFDKNEPHDRDTARSRHGYFITYKGCPITWKSTLQGEITLSSTESEYTGLSYALRDAIPIMQILNEMKSHGFDINNTVAQVKCKVFEDNSGALEMARTHKFRPRTKHLSVKLHHFRDYVTRKEITVHKIDTKEQLADFLTKPVNFEILKPLRKRILGW